MKSFLALITIFCFLACIGSKNQLNLNDLVDAAGVVSECDSSGQESDKKIDFPIIAISHFVLEVSTTSLTPSALQYIALSQPYFQIETSEVTSTGPPVA